MNLHYRKAVVFSCLLMAAVLTTGCRQEEAGSAGPERPTVGVVKPVQRPVIEYATFTGRLQALESANVVPQVTGYLQKVCYQPGAKVAKDAVLFEIDPAQYQAQVDLAKGKLAEAKAQVKEAEAKVLQYKAQVDLNQSKLAINVEVAKTPGAMSRQKLEESEAAVKESQATMEAAKATVVALEASVKAANANLQYSQLNLDWTKVKAPINGRVERNILTVGNLVNANVTILTNIVATGDVYAYFDVDELRYLDMRKKIREGVYEKPEAIPIAIALQNEEDFRHEGTVDVVANALSSSTGTMQVRAILKNAQNFLTPGNFVRVRLPLDKAREKLLVPDRAVVYEQGDAYLLVVNAEDKVDKRKVALGPLDPGDKSLRVIHEGVKADDRVIVQGRQRVRPDAVVKVELVSSPEKAGATSEASAAKK
jgi:RND family efflux transporter MFP subunit